MPHNIYLFQTKMGLICTASSIQTQLKRLPMTPLWANDYQ